MHWRGEFQAGRVVSEVAVQMFLIFSHTWHRQPVNIEIEESLLLSTRKRLWWQSFFKEKNIGRRSTSRRLDKLLSAFCLIRGPSRHGLFKQAWQKKKNLALDSCCIVFEKRYKLSPWHCLIFFVWTQSPGDLQATPCQVVRKCCSRRDSLQM